jgi:hypothetical protein
LRFAAGCDQNAGFWIAELISAGILLIIEKEEEVP